jgi:PadR family transcriptional regulator AphA
MARNRTTFAILGFLAEHPMSGYDIKKRVEASIDNFWSESFGQIYPSLRRLSDQGLIDKRTEKSEGGRPRHVYTILEPGRRALALWLDEPTDPPPLRLELLLKLFFGAQVDTDSSRRQVIAYREDMMNDLKHYRAIAEGLEKSEGTLEHLPYWLMTLRFGERDRKAHIEWCDETLAQLDRLPNPASGGSDDRRKTS